MIGRTEEKMKKILAVILTVTMLVGALSVMGSAVYFELEQGFLYDETYVMGDVNDDGKVNVSDVVLIRRHIVGGYGDSIIEDAADIDEDGDIDTRDVVFLRQYLLGGYPDADAWFN